MIILWPAKKLINDVDDLPDNKFAGIPKVSKGRSESPLVASQCEIPANPAQIGSGESLHFLHFHIAVFHLPPTRANNRQAAGSRFIVPGCRCFLKLSHTPGSPPQVWWVAVRKYHYRPEKLFAFCLPKQNSGAACTAQPKLSSRRRLFAPSSGELYLLFGCSIVKVRTLHPCTFSTFVPGRSAPHSGHFCSRNRGAGLCKATAGFSAALHRLLIHHFLNATDQFNEGHGNFFR